MVRVRFAPSPTGIMHLGNIRIALLNYLFAKKNNGVFIIRIEDTDLERNYDPGAEKILQDLHWLKLDYDEGPKKNSPYGPFFQSERLNIYAEELKKLQEGEFVYRCFCTKEELEKKRKRQISLKQPPRYDQTCLKLSKIDIDQKLHGQVPYIWRVRIEHTQKLLLDDMAHGIMTFDLKNFTDFPLTRTDGSFTFMFANCVDDILMEISHVIRGEDHLTNTVGQVVLYHAFGKNPPRFWHQPILANIDGKKLSKRDFGFSLYDLRDAGFLPEAITNYLGIIGGSFEQEIMSIEELIAHFDTKHISPTGMIKYDVEKLRWVNHKWINKLDNKKLTAYALPYIEKTWPQAHTLSQSNLENLIEAIKTDIHSLDELPDHVRFYFEEPTVSVQDLEKISDQKTVSVILLLIKKNLNYLSNSDKFLEEIKTQAKENEINFRYIGSALRLILTGHEKGIGLKLLLDTLKYEQCKKRLDKILG